MKALAILVLAAMVFGTAQAGSTSADEAPQPKYGLAGQLRCAPGQRDALIAILLDGADAMPGCLSYVVSKDREDADMIWITEAWESEADHTASLKLPAVQQRIEKGRPLMTGFGERFEMEPVGGHGLVKLADPETEATGR